MSHKQINNSFKNSFNLILIFMVCSHCTFAILICSSSSVQCCMFTLWTPSSDSDTNCGLDLFFLHKFHVQFLPKRHNFSYVNRSWNQCKWQVCIVSVLGVRICFVIVFVLCEYIIRVRLYSCESESDISSRWVRREPNLMFKLSSDKDQRKMNL